MANFPQLDDTRGVWKLKEVHDAVAGGYWRNAGSKAVFAGGFNSSNAYTATIDTIKMASAGNATDFGDLATDLLNMGTCASFTRGIFMGGNQASPNAYNNETYYITFASEGNAAQFGTLTTSNQHATSASNSTRGLCMGGFNPSAVQNTVDYITMASVGNSTDFGDLTAATNQAASMNSPTRALYVGGATPGLVNTIQFAEFSTTGNFTDFGDLIATLKQGTKGDLGSSTRGVRAGGILASDAFTTSVEFVTMASQGNAIDYGDCTTASRLATGASNSVKSFLAGGDVSDAVGTNVIQQGVITTGGDWTDFGDLTVAKYGGGGTSNAHGGLNDGHQGTRNANLPFGKITSRGVNLGTIGLFNAGEISAGTNVMDFINIASTGNATDWGDLSAANSNGGATASETRYVTNGNNTTSLDMNYVEFATKGNTALFGDLTVRRHLGGTGGNKTRGIMYSGFNPDNNRGDTADGACNVMDFITYASLGDATDFGDANVASFFAGGCSSATRTLKFGGISEGPATLTDSIEFVSTASTGNGADFGNLLAANESPTLGPISSSTRGVVAGGKTPGIVNVIQYVTLASEGNATDFGNLTAARAQPGGACSATRGTFAGGEEPSVGNRIDFVTIATTANAADFGDLTITVSRHGGNSNGNGGLS